MSEVRASFKRKSLGDRKVEKSPKRLKAEETKEEKTFDKFFDDFSHFIKKGIEFLDARSYAPFWEWIDIYHDRISEYDFTFYEYYHAIEDFINFLIQSREERIQSGETDSDLMFDDEEEAYQYYDATLSALEDHLITLINMSLASSDDENIAKLANSAKSCDEYIKIFKSCSNLDRSKVVYIDNPDFIYGAENKRKECKMPGIEKLLHLYQTGQDSYNKLQKNSDFKYVNLSLAHLSFIVTDKPHQKGGDHKRVVIDMPVSNGSELASIVNFASDSRSRKAALLDRSNAAIEMLVSKHPNRSDVIESEIVEDILKQPDFHRQFHHSEQAVAEYLKQDSFMDKIILFLKSKNILPGHKVYAAVLDMYTTQNSCQHCGQAMLGIQNPNSAEFVAKLNKKLKDEGYIISDKKRTKLGIRKRGSHNTTEKDPGVRMVVRAIHDRSYNSDKSKEEKIQAASPVPSVSTDIRYITQTFFMTKHSSLRPSKLASTLKDEKASFYSMPGAYTIFSSRQPSKIMQDMLKKPRGVTAKRF